MISGHESWGGEPRARAQPSVARGILAVSCKGGGEPLDAFDQVAQLQPGLGLELLAANAALSFSSAIEELSTSSNARWPTLFARQSEHP